MQVHVGEINKRGLFMKKLIYIWVNNYKNKIIQQGYQLSPEILVKTEVLNAKNTEQVELSVHLTDNRSHIVKNFYGKNISSLMAIVGKNGSGKTLVSRMLLEYLPDGLHSNDSLNNPDLMQSLGCVSDWDNKALYVFYDDEKGIVTFCPNHVSLNYQHEQETNEIEYKIMELNNLYKELSTAVQCGIYLTNVFNPSEFLDSYHKLGLESGTIKFQQTYSPAFILKHEAEEQTKSLYGYQCAGNQYIGVLQKYAQEQMHSLYFAYMNKQAALFLNSYQRIPEKIKDDLHVYQEFDIDVVEFGTYSEVYPYVNLDSDGNYKKAFHNLELNDQALITAKAFYVSKIHDIGKNVLILLYFNMLLEVYIVFVGSNNNIIQELENLFNSGITAIDNNILNLVKNHLLDNKLPQNDWENQIVEFIDFLLKQDEKSWVGAIGNRSFAETEFLEWYYKEITKKTSFVKRNLIFRWKPTSSGEMAIANLFAYLDDAIENLAKTNEKQNILLIVDELDCYLHPQWQQYVINLLLDRLQEYTNYTFQLIITSHSPIILSDLCKDNVLKLDQLQAQLETKKTFGADISHLYYDSFFMEEGDIGDFAKQNIKLVIQALKEENLTEEEKLLFIIENIGQDIVRERLRGKYQLLQQRKQKQEHDSMEIAQKINALDSTQREKVLNYINQMKTM